MQDIVGQISLLTGSAATPENMKKMNKFLNENAKVLRKGVNAIDGILTDVLTLPQNTLGFLHLMTAKTSVEVKDHNQCFDQIRRVLLSGDIEQISIAPHLFAGLARKFTDSVTYTERFLKAIHPLQVAMQKLQGTNANLLTSVHANFVQVCLKAKCFSTALPVLESPLFEIQKETGIEPVDYLQYYYYGGMVFCGMKKFAKALEFFQMALTCPSKVLSAIQVEAYKKYVCCSLILTGEVAPLPSKLMSPVVARGAVRLAGHYEAFARAYKLGVEHYTKALPDHLEAFKKDKNWGLIKQAIEAFARRSISRLTATYVTLSIGDITRDCGIRSAKDCERILVSMIEDGSLFAQINQKDGMVIFEEQPDEYSSTAMIKALDGKVQEVMHLTDKLKAKERDIVTNQRYIVRTTPGLTANIGGGGAGGPAGAAAAMMGGPGGFFGGPGDFGGEDEDYAFQRAVADSRMHS